MSSKPSLLKDLKGFLSQLDSQSIEDLSTSHHSISQDDISYRTPSTKNSSKKVTLEILPSALSSNIRTTPITNNKSSPLSIRSFTESIDLHQNSTKNNTSINSPKKKTKGCFSFLIDYIFSYYPPANNDNYLFVDNQERIMSVMSNILSEWIVSY